MQKEISMMREILSNMQQEELSLQHGDQSNWNHVVQLRAEMIERLVFFRTERMEATEMLKQLTSPSKLIFSLDDEATCELFWMRDQMSALLEKMNLQNTRNQNLYPSSFQPHAHAHAMPHMPLEAPQVQRKKGTVATYPKNQ